MIHFPSRKIIFAFVILVILVLGSTIFLGGDTKDTTGLKPFIISGNSMEPTIADGDQVFTDLDYYKTHQIEKGDVVAIEFSLSSNKIKRVIAVGGDKVEFTGNSILVNGTPSPTDYLKNSSVSFNPSKLRILRIQLGEKGIVPGGALLVLGDNRFPSEDSQQFGLIMAEQVMGKVLFKKEGWRTVTI